MPIQEKLDVIIVGGGPAGISAAVWCADLGMSAIVLEDRDQLYGQLRWIHGPIKNYPGIIANDGTELIGMFDRTVAEWGIRVGLNAAVEAVDSAARSVSLSDGRAFTGAVVIIATGIRRRTLGLPGEAEFQGKGVLISGAGEKDKVRGKRVVVVGGGDAALENALLLSEFAEQVFLVHRRDSLSARTEFQEQIRLTPNIELILDSEIAEIGGRERVEWVDVKDHNGERTNRIDTDHFIARIGVVPNSELIASQLSVDERGYILIDQFCRTSADGVYAIGDVASPISPTIPTAVGMGATAAKSAFSLITASKKV